MRMALLLRAVYNLKLVWIIYVCTFHVVFSGWGWRQITKTMERETTLLVLVGETTVLLSNALFLSTWEKAFMWTKASCRNQYIFRSMQHHELLGRELSLQQCSVGITYSYVISAVRVGLSSLNILRKFFPWLTQTGAPHGLHQEKQQKHSISYCAQIQKGEGSKAEDKFTAW